VLSNIAPPSGHNLSCGNQEHRRAFCFVKLSATRRCDHGHEIERRERRRLSDLPQPGHQKGTASALTETALREVRRDRVGAAKQPSPDPEGNLSATLIDAPDRTAMISCPRLTTNSPNVVPFQSDLVLSGLKIRSSRRSEGESAFPHIERARRSWRRTPSVLEAARSSGSPDR